MAYWNSVVSTLETLSEAARELASKLRTVRRANFDSFLLRAEKELKSTTELDDQKWKYLCETARTESRAELKYQQSSTQSEKARERIQSFEAKAEVTTKNRDRAGSQPKITAGMSKAIGNMFSILPNGGEQAMKMMSSDARRVVAQSTLDESSQRESKDKQTLEAAKRTKDQGIETYTTSAKKLVETFDQDDETGWNDVVSALENFMSSCSEYKSHFLEAMEALVQTSVSSEEKIQDISDWTVHAADNISGKVEQYENEAEVNGFALSVKLADSQKVYKLLSLVGTDDEGDTDDEFVADDTDTDSPKKLDDDTVPDAPTPKRFSNGALSTASTRELMSLADDLRERSDGTVVEKVGISVRPQSPDLTSFDSADIGLARFLPEKDSKGNAIEIGESFSCTYWPKESQGHMSRLIQGRMYVTNTTLFVVGWDGKKLFFEWDTIDSLSKESGLSGTKDDAIRVTCGENSFFFGKIAKRDDVFEMLEKHRVDAAEKKAQEEKVRAEREKKEKEAAALEATASGDRSAGASVVPPDDTIGKMHILLQRSLKNVSIKTFYDVAWSEGQDTSAEKLYAPWLKELGSMKVEVSDWTMEDIKNPWCGEVFPQSRDIRFEFKRTTHLYVGPPIATVNQKHCCRVEGNDRCVLQMTVSMEGIPYADAFAVEVRWVATRVGLNDIQVQVGVAVDFKKSTMFAKQIKSGTLVETKPIHAKLFERIKKNLPADSLGTSDQDDETEEENESAEDDDDVDPTIVGISLSQAQKHINTIIGKFSEGDPIYIAGVALAAYVLIYFLYRLFEWIFFSSSNVANIETSDSPEMVELATKIDTMQEEMRQMRQILDAIRAILEAQSEKTEAVQ